MIRLTVHGREYYGSSSWRHLFSYWNILSGTRVILSWNMYRDDG
jgi:hypothetical protein